MTKDNDRLALLDTLDRRTAWSTFSDMKNTFDLSNTFLEIPFQSDTFTIHFVVYSTILYHMTMGLTKQKWPEVPVG